MIKFNQIVLICIVALLIPNVVYAAIDNDIANTILDRFSTTMVLDYGAYLLNLAKSLFFLLITIDIVIIGARLIFGGDDIREFAREIVFLVLTIGFMWFLIIGINGTYGDIGRIIQRGFVSAAQSGSTYTAVNPSEIFTIGTKLARQLIINKSTFFGIFTGANFGFTVMALGVILIFAYLTARLLMVLIEAAFYMYGGMILLGFLGSKYTRDIGLTYFRLMFSVGMKLFVMLIMYSMLIGLLNDWIGGAGTTPIKNDAIDSEESFTLLFSTLFIYMVLIMNIPEYVQGLVSGISFSSGEKLTSAVRSGVASGMAIAGGAATAAAGGASLASETGKAIQGADKAAKAAGTGIAGRGITAAATAISATAKGMAAVATEQAQNPFRGNVAGRTAAAMKEERLSSTVESGSRNNVVSNGNNNSQNGNYATVNFSVSSDGKDKGNKGNDYENSEYGESDLKDEK